MINDPGNVLVVAAAAAVFVRLFWRAIANLLIMLVLFGIFAGFLTMVSMVQSDTLLSPCEQSASSVC